MDQKTYELGKPHYWEGIEVTAMDCAAPEARISWLCGWLDARLEHRVLARSSANRNRRSLLPVNRPIAVRPLQRMAVDT
jgi:hypothetical protein